MSPDSFRADRAAWLLALSLPLLLAHAFVPLDRFILRGDDAFYYFGVAANYERIGHWTFDTLHRTNGVQPLWAMILTGVARVSAALGVNDRETLARIFVAVTALAHFASGMILFRLLVRRICLMLAVAVAGAWLFPPGLVWVHVWGMENSLYALMLISTIAYFVGPFADRPTLASACVLGLLAGCTALSRLNAVILIPCLLGWMLLARREMPRASRFALAAVATVAAGLLVGGYLLYNLQQTGHMLPISGAVKTIYTQQFLDAHHIDSRFSPAFFQTILREFRPRLSWFISSRIVDGLWLIGGRLAFHGDSGVGFKNLGMILAGLLVAPMFLGGPRAWLGVLRDAFARLWMFGFVLVFALFNGVISIMSYPDQLRYAIPSWWLVETELVLVVLGASLAVALVRHVASRFGASSLRTGFATVILAGLIAFHVAQTFRLYWGRGEMRFDWSRSWNDESYRAAKWMSDHLPADAIVGSWNAGVVGYYADQRIVNLDGLINNFELLPYLRSGDVAGYILHEKIDYLSDMDSLIQRRVGGALRLAEVYRNDRPDLNDSYRVYQVMGALASRP